MTAAVARRAAEVPERQQATARTRRYRERLENGVVVAPVPTNREVIAFLLDLGWIGDHESEDRRQVGLAIARLLEEAAGARR